MLSVRLKSIEFSATAELSETWADKSGVASEIGVSNLISLSAKAVVEILVSALTSLGSSLTSEAGISALTYETTLTSEIVSVLISGAGISALVSAGAEILPHVLAEAQKNP